MNEYTLTVEATSMEEARTAAVRAAERQGLWVYRVIRIRQTRLAGHRMDLLPGQYEVQVQGDQMTESEHRAVEGDR